MKKLILFSFSLLIFLNVSAQSSPSQAPYLRFPTIPPFTLINIDSSNITRNNLKKNKKTLIMYFSPTCDHCQVQTDSMLVHINKFKDIQILMASYQPLPEILHFYNQRQISKYKNISMGQDSKYFFPPFYKIGSLPFMALYNKKGAFITSFQGNASIEKIMEAFAR